MTEDTSPVARARQAHPIRSRADGDLGLVRFFDKLNTPVVVTVVLVLALAVNGFLLFRQPTSTTAAAPDATKNEAVISGDTTTSDSIVSGGSEDSEGTTATQDSAVSEIPEDVEDTTPAPDSDVFEEPEETAPAPEILVSEEMGEFIRGCDGDRKECVRGFVARAAPEASYIGGRADLNAGGPGRNREILYFEDPTLGTCEHVRQEYAVNDSLTYAIIVVGRGSFDIERGSECIPQA